MAAGNGTRHVYRQIEGFLFLKRMQATHLVLWPFNFNFSCPRDPMAVLKSTFHAELNSVLIRTLHGRGLI